MALLLCIFAAAACTPLAAALRSGAADGRTLRATPVEKVISLLHQISDQIQEEGAKEAAEYDKYACFCKNQAGEKSRAIDKSNAKIDQLTAKITALDGDIVSLNDDISTLGLKIQALEGEIANETTGRRAEFQSYTIEEQNVTEAIKAVEDALTTLRASKAQVQGASLAEIHKTLSRLPGAALVTALLESHVALGKQPAYKYSSDDIIAVLQNLLRQFKARKDAIFKDDHRKMSTSEQKVLGLTNQKKFAQKEKVQKEAISNAKSADVEALRKEKTGETTARDADEAFRTELTTQCQDKATEWDQRSQTRANELTTISQAVDMLKSGVVPTYGANRKLVGLQHSVVIHPGKDNPLRDLIPLGFVQEVQELHHKGSGTDESSAPKRALKLLDSAIARLHSPALAALAAKVALKADNFVKVRGLIKDLILRLQNEATTEASQKTFCDTEMAKATSSRDSEKLNMEQQAAVETEKKAEVQQLREEIASLSQDIADLNQALNEATELRAEEKAGNDRTVADATSGKRAVEEAIQLLQSFYGSFVQSAQPVTDRRGSTIADLAPETSYSGDYRGKQEASQGILGLLQVILDDFDRTISTVGAAESAAVTKFQTFETTTQTTITTKTTEKDGKETSINTLETEITAAQGAYSSAKSLFELAERELLNLRSQCVDSTETAAERKAKREQEIEALKQALQILENWQS